MITHDIEAAAESLRRGDAVAFPTETVYGLGASALDTHAVDKVFALKGRPSNNPLIVHVSTIEMAQELVTSWPDHAAVLAEHFWPGPLTLVLPKSDAVPNNVTGGGGTVAIRVPNHPIALELISEVGGPIVGPSANVSGGVSPTAAAHVDGAFTPDILVLEGGACTTGIESTVVRVTVDGAQVLRPGVIGVEDLAKVVPVVESDPVSNTAAPLPSPGLLTKHYAPGTPTKFADEVAEDLLGAGAILLAISPAPAGQKSIQMPTEAGAYAARLYAALREADAMNADLILIERPTGNGPIWDAVRDRLRRATAAG